AVHLAEKLVRAWIGGREVGGVTKRSRRVLVLAARIVGDPQADIQPRRLRMTLDGGGEHLTGFVERLKVQQVVAPVEQMFFGRIRVRRALILFRRGEQIALTLLDVSE